MARCFLFFVSTPLYDGQVLGFRLILLDLSWVRVAGKVLV